jgi:isopropylmalate/homocitrate/citramalate synthase
MTTQHLNGVDDVDAPELFPDAYPPDGFPQVVFEGERPATLPAQAWTTETTHRDGQQGGLPLSAEDGIRIYDLMCAFTGQSGAIRQAEFFVYREDDRQMLAAALERHAGGAPVEPTTWIRASTKDAELVRQLGVRESGMLASASDLHTFYKFKPGGRAQAARSYLDAVRAVLDAGIRPRLHLEDATRAPREFVLPFVAAAMEVAAPYGEAFRPKIRVCDTMGLGLPWEDVAWPRSVPRMIRELREAGVASEDLEFHPHNDTHLVVANCLAAVRAGVSAINGTLLAKGERSGNAPLEGVLVHLLGLGYVSDPPPDFGVLNELAELYASIGDPVPAKYPLYGRDAHRTRAGIHADGLNKNWRMYAPFDVPALLGRPFEVSITPESGLAGLIFILKQHKGVELAKDDPRLLELHAWVEEQFSAGRQTAIEWEELSKAFGEGQALPQHPLPA